ncbi:hypothetical protein [Actinocorallia herbida]|uniref:hypothetical protein n=1 Tax=Actinocorallia herbida TaxID=58109 RepID=UPI000F4B887D|nr:hypothetical protein [Actinocorallia herbida]
MAVVVSVLSPIQASARAEDPPVTSASVTLAADAKDVATGTKVTLTGTLRGETAEGATVDLTGREVVIREVDRRDEELTAVTDAKGVFTKVVTPHTTTYWEAAFTLGAKEYTSRPVGVRVLDGTLLFDFAVAHDARRQVTASARFKLSTDPGPGGADSAVQLQFSPDGKEPWRTAQTLRPDHEGRLATSFRQSTPGWWRMYFPGTKNYAPATTKVIKAWRWSTSITGLKVTPRKLKVGKKITVTGVLKRFTAKSRKKTVPFAGRKVTVIFKCLKGAAWYTAVSGRTSKKGTFTLKPKTWCDANYQVVFDGSADTFRAYSKSVKIDTKGKPLL